MSKQIIRWKFILPIAGVVSLAAVCGFKSGEQARAYVSFTKHRYQEALDLYSKVGDESGCGMVFLAKNSPDAARKHFEAAGDESGLGLVELKKREYKKAMARFSSKNDHRGLGLAHLGLKDEVKARAAFAKANDWSGLGLLALAKNDTKGAVVAFNKAQDESGLGLTDLREQKYAEALAHFEKAKDDSGIGLVHLAQRNHAAASESFRKANDLSGLGYVLLAQGDFSGAEKLFTETNDKNGLGDLYSGLHQFAKAREMFEADNNPVKVIQSYRNDYTLKNHIEEAIAYGKKAVAEEKMVPECLMETADALYDLKRYQEALALLDQAAAIQGYSSEAQIRKGRIYFYLRDLDKAEQAFSAVKKEDFTSERRYQEAQTSLATVARYRQIFRQNPGAFEPADSF